MCIPRTGAMQWLGKQVPAATNTCNNRIVGCAVFHVVRVMSKESRRLVRPRTFCVEVGSNTYSVALRVVGGEEKGTQCLGV
jgi:hypothetical protein